MKPRTHQRHRIAKALWSARLNGAGHTFRDLATEAVLTADQGGDEATAIDLLDYAGITDRLERLYQDEPEDSVITQTLLRYGVIDHGDAYGDCGSCSGTGIGRYGPPDVSTCRSCRGRGYRLPRD